MHHFWWVVQPNGATVYISAYNDGNSISVVRLIVENDDGRVSGVEKIYAIKKESIQSSQAANRHPSADGVIPSGLFENLNAMKSTFKLNIDAYLEIVNRYDVVNSILPKDVINALKSFRKSDPNVTPYLRFSRMDSTFDSFMDEQLAEDRMKLERENESLRLNDAPFLVHRSTRIPQLRPELKKKVPIVKSKAPSCEGACFVLACFR